MTTTTTTCTTVCVRWTFVEGRRQSRTKSVYTSILFLVQSRPMTEQWNINHLPTKNHRLMNKMCRFVTSQQTTGILRTLLLHKEKNKNKNRLCWVGTALHFYTHIPHTTHLYTHIYTLAFVILYKKLRTRIPASNI